MAIGDEYIDVHANMDPFDREVERGARETSRDADGEFKRAGRDIGKTMGDSASEEFGHHGGEFGRRLQEDIRHRPIKVKQKVNVDYDVDSDRLGAEIHGAIDEAFAPGGPIDKIGRKIGLAFGDAFGAGFGVSGRSALIPFIVVLVGAIVALVVAALQAVNALVAVLVTIPAVLLALGLQVGVLFLAFKGLGNAISGAFEAKNAKELNEAIKDLTPSAKAFVKQLLPLRDLFDYMKRVAQEGFFKELGDVISRIQEALGPTFGFNIKALAEAMGGFVRQLGLIFADPIFVKLLNDLIPATINWLNKFGPGFANFLLGLVKLADSAMPFLNKLGESLSGGLGKFGDFLKKLADDPKFQKWLQDMFDTLKSVGDLFYAVTLFVISFLDTLNKEGGKELIDELTKAFLELAAFFGSETGQKAMRAFIDLLEAMVAITTFLILAFFYAIAAIREFLLWVGAIALGVKDFFAGVIEGIDKFLTGINNIPVVVAAAFGKAMNAAKETWHSLQNAVASRITNIIETAKGIPDRIKNAVGDLKDLLINAGKSLIQGLIDGILKMKGALKAATLELLHYGILQFLPGSPAKEGPLSGQGYSLIRGQHLVQDMVKGIKMETPGLRSATSNAVTNITFGAGSVSVGFQGVVPTPEQARVTGAAAGQGIIGQLAVRDTRLAVRTL